MAAHGYEMSLLVLGVSLLIGGLAIHIGAKFALASREYSHAVFTALLGAIAWVIVDIIFSSVGIGGIFASFVGLIVWIWVIRWQYSLGWIRASVVGFGAWLSALLVLGLLGLLGIGSLDAFGVPGV